MKRNWEIIFVIIFVLIAAWPLFIPGYFPHHDDLQVIRIFEMRECFKDLQLPCRWSSNLGYGNGLPIFNYYSAFPYYLGAIISYLTGFILASKSLFFVTLLIAGVSMYLLVKELFGNLPAVVSSALYVLVPYRALNVYVRGALSESFALAIIPLILYFLMKLAKKADLGAFLGSIVGLTILFTSHNISTLLFTPIILVWAAFWSVYSRNKNWKLLFLSLVFGLSLSSFFLFPAYFEKNLVQTENLTIGYFDFRNHFAGIKQLFLERTWGYGSSLIGPGDSISLSIGLPHWAGVFIGILLFLTRIKKVSKETFWIMILAALVFFGSIFMTHNRSTLIWESLDILKYVQFPWRFLGVAAVFSSLIIGASITFLRKSWRGPIGIILILLAFILNFEYFKPLKIYPLTDKERLSGEIWRDQQRGAVFDYLPITAKNPTEIAPEHPVVLVGEATIESFIESSNSWEMDIRTDGGAVVEVPVYAFPIWEVDGFRKGISEEGRISVEVVGEGTQKVKGVFKDTPLRIYSNLLSLGSLISLALFAYYGKNRKVFN